MRLDNISVAYPRCAAVFMFIAGKFMSRGFPFSPSCARGSTVEYKDQAVLIGKVKVMKKKFVTNETASFRMSNEFLSSLDIFCAVDENKNEFRKILQKSCPWEIKGILNSEMLLFISLIEILGAERVIESGRARGQSTEIIARWLDQRRKRDGVHLEFDSIEYDKHSADASVAERKVEGSGFPVRFLFGDARKMMPKLLATKRDSSTIILIDGPKGIDAVQLALKALKNDNVKAVCIHDIHKDDKKLRCLIETMWPRNFASDDEDFVAGYAYLDTNCWDEHQKHELFKGWGPYVRGTRRMISYGPTLICLINYDRQLGFNCYVIKVIFTIYSLVIKTFNRTKQILVKLKDSA